MTEPLPSIDHGEDRVVIEIPSGRWEGTAAEAERLLTGLHYALGRARPGTNIASVFVNGGLWGGKFVEEDPERALELMRSAIEDLAALVGSMDAGAPAAGVELDKP